MDLGFREREKQRKMSIAGSRYRFQGMEWVVESMGVLDYLSHALNSVRGVIQGSIIGVSKGNARSVVWLIL